MIDHFQSNDVKVCCSLGGNLVKETPQAETEEQSGRYRPTLTSSLYKRYYDAAKARITSSTILVANAYSGTAILLMCFLTNIFGIK